MEHPNIYLIQIILLKYVSYLFVFTSSILLILFILVLYKHFFWLLRRIFKPISDYLLVIESKKNFYKDATKLGIVILVVYLLFCLRKIKVSELKKTPFSEYFNYRLEIPHLANYRELVETAYYFKSNLSVILIILLVLGLLVLFLFFRFYLLYYLYKVKTLCIRLHIYCLQMRYYNSIKSKMFAIEYFYLKFYYRILFKLFKKERIAILGFQIHSTSLLLENFLAKYFMLLLIYFEILTRNGELYYVTQVFPYYFLYTLSRFCIMKWYSWFQDIAYLILSQELYQNLEKQAEIKEVVKFIYKVYLEIIFIILFIFLFQILLFICCLLIQGLIVVIMLFLLR